MRLAAVMLEEHPRRAVQLRDDHALGAVDYERAGGGHERDFAHVHFLLLHLLRRGLGRLLVHDHEPHLGAQRRGVGEPPLLAFLDVERRLAERVAHELQPRALGMALDRIDTLERGLQAFALAPLRGHVLLQKSGVRVDLRRQQERHRQDVVALGKALADTLLFGERVRHVSSREKSAPALQASRHLPRRGPREMSG